MINEKNKFLTASWLSGLLSAEIFISTGECRWLQVSGHGAIYLWIAIFFHFQFIVAIPNMPCQNFFHGWVVMSAVWLGWTISTCVDDLQEADGYCHSHYYYKRDNLGTLTGDVQNWAILIQNYILQVSSLLDNGY